MGGFGNWVGYRNRNIMAVPDTKSTECEIGPLIGTDQRFAVPNKSIQSLDAYLFDTR